MLHVAEEFIDKNYHPTVICRGSIDLELYMQFLMQVFVKASYLQRTIYVP